MRIAIQELNQLAVNGDFLVLEVRGRKRVVSICANPEDGNCSGEQNQQLAFHLSSPEKTKIGPKILSKVAQGRQARKGCSVFSVARTRRKYPNHAACV